MNLIDEAKRHQITIEDRSLTRHLGIPVIPTSARYEKGMPELLQAIHNVATGEYVCKPHKIKNVPNQINNAVIKLTKEIEIQYPDIPNSRWIAFRLLEGDKSVINALRSGQIS